MTDTTVVVATPIRNASLDLARSVLMGVGAVPFVAGIATGEQWQAIVGGLLALASAIWSYVAAHPSKGSALQSVLSLVRLGGQGASWNAGVSGLATAVLPIAETAVDAQIKAKAGILAGPVDVAANAAIKAAVATAAKSFLYPQP